MKQLVGEHYLDLMPYPPGKPIEETERELGISGIIKLASNENPLGISPRALAAMRIAIDRVALYPDGNAFYLKEKLSEHLSRWNISPAHIVLGNGTNEIISMSIRAFILSGENALSAWPAFVMYRLGLKAAARRELCVPLDASMGYDVEALVAAVDQNTKMIFIANPNNPIGRYITTAEFEYLLERIPEDVIVFMDEAYFEYVNQQDYPNAMDYLGKRKRLIVSRTFSKIYGLAGIRLGYAVADPELIDFLNRGREPFNTNLVAQAAGTAALEDTAFVSASRDSNATELAWLQQEYARLGLRTIPSVANFVLVDFASDGNAVFRALLHKGVIVRPMGGYGLPTWARITVGTREQNQRLIGAIEELMPSSSQTS